MLQTWQGLTAFLPRVGELIVVLLPYLVKILCGSAQHSWILRTMLASSVQIQCNAWRLNSTLPLKGRFVLLKATASQLLEDTVEVWALFFALHLTPGADDNARS